MGVLQHTEVQQPKISCFLYLLSCIWFDFDCLSVCGADLLNGRQAFLDFPILFCFIPAQVFLKVWDCSWKWDLKWSWGGASTCSRLVTSITQYLLDPHLKVKCLAIKGWPWINLQVSREDTIGILIVDWIRIESNQSCLFIHRYPFWSHGFSKIMNIIRRSRLLSLEGSFYVMDSCRSDSAQVTYFSQKFYDNGNANEELGIDYYPSPIGNCNLVPHSLIQERPQNVSVMLSMHFSQMWNRLLLASLWDRFGNIILNEKPNKYLL